jgi:hypothetical protein
MFDYFLSIVDTKFVPYSSLPKQGATQYDHGVLEPVSHKHGIEQF